MEGLQQILNIAEILHKAEVSRGGIQHLENKIYPVRHHTKSGSCLLENMICPEI